MTARTDPTPRRLDVHDPVAPTVREGALFGELVQPPRIGWDGQRYTGAQPVQVDLDAARKLPGVVCVLHEGACVGVVAVSPLHARQAVELIEVRWDAPARRAPPAPATHEARTAYTWAPAPAASHPTGSVTAWCHESGVTVWAERIDAAACRRELALLTGLPASRIDILQTTSPAVPTGPHALDTIDAAAAAVLLSRAAQAPVCVPVRAATRTATAPLRVTVQDPGPGRESAPADAPVPLTLHVPSPWAERPSLARLLGHREDVLSPQPLPRHTPYAGVEVRLQPMPGDAPPATGTQLREAQTFALESQLDASAAQAGTDPVAYRLRRLGPGRASTLLQAVARRAGWRAEVAGRAPTPAWQVGERLRGRGVAFAEATGPAGDPGTRWSAWVADVEVDPASGEVAVTRVVVGHDSQDLQPATVMGLVAENGPLLTAAQRLLHTPSFDDWGSGAMPAVPHAGARPALRETLLAAPGASGGHLQHDGVLTLPATAAIANAVFQATGVRLRQAPFDRDMLRDALAAHDRDPGAEADRPRLASPATTQRRAGAWLAGAATAAAGLVAMAWPAKPALPPTPGPDLSLYAAEALERGRLVAAAGDCVVCHTAPGGAPNAGGLPLETPFGTIYSTNITPDPETGIGRWSFAAFDRAMRQGVHRDGRQLYPAFPYTAFAKISDADMQALYGYLMSEAPVAARPPETKLAFPYSLRPMMAGWNALFHDASPYVPDPGRSVEWNRGAYLVQGAGHCGACHTPRNALGAEKTGASFLAGADVEGWHAPALNTLGSGPTPWTADALYRYLRTGYSAQHGVAAGPMAPVIHGLAQLPERDVRAMATYLTSLDASNATVAAAVAPTAAPAPAPATAPAVSVETLPLKGERIYQNACAVCHEAGEGPTLFGAKPALAASTGLRLAQPDNLIQVILHGIQAPASGELGYMPAFKDNLDDAQVAALLDYLQLRFAPDATRWTDTAARVRALRDPHAPSAK